jgi:hypothetical protein
MGIKIKTPSVFVWFTTCRIRAASHNPWMRRQIFPGAKGVRWPVSITRSPKPTRDGVTGWVTRHFWFHAGRISYGLRIVSVN